MAHPPTRGADPGQDRRGQEAAGRRDVLLGSAAASAASLLPLKRLSAQRQSAGVAGAGAAADMAPSGGLLRPKQNRFRNVLDVSGLWRFQLDPRGEGEARGWARALPAPRPIAVPCSWNDLFDDAHDHLGPAWYQTEIWVPSAWRDQRVFLRVGSANYAAKVWVNGTVVAEHMGGHLPFGAEIGAQLDWDRPNIVAIRVENEQLPERVPPGFGPAGGGVAAALGGHPATTYDFFPYAGLHRQVVLHSVPADGHISDITVITSIDGSDGVVDVEVAVAGGYAGRGKIGLDGIEADLEFRGGSAKASLRIPSARFWGPRDPYLYRLTATLLADGQRTTDSYELDIGVRTIKVRGDQLLLNGQPIKLTGFGKHEDFPVHGRGLDLPAWVRDYELLRWVGANSYRTSHYPYAEEAMQLADELGVLVINEIPAVGLNLGDPDELTERRLSQCLRQLRELVARDKNHPSTIMWSLANEPIGGKPVGAPPPASGGVAAGLRFFGRLVDEARRLDGTRPVSLVGAQGGPEEWLGLGDAVCVNRYYGWYTQAGRLDEATRLFGDDLDELHKRFGKPVIVAEFGADALPGAHSAPPEMWTEEYQAELIRRYLDATAERPFVAGTHVWNFADFKTGQGIMRAGAMNHKGVFTRDRRPKLAAHFLRSRWAKA